jgi:hypothetical protein
MEQDPAARPRHRRHRLEALSAINDHTAVWPSTSSTTCSAKSLAGSAGWSATGLAEAVYGRPDWEDFVELAVTGSAFGASSIQVTPSAPCSRI